MHARSALIRIVLAACAVSSAAPAQSLLGLSGGGPSVEEWSGPPAGPCSYPAGGPLGSFVLAPGPCPVPGPVAPPPAMIGDIAADPLTDTVFVTDGVLIGVYTAAGAYVDAFGPVPGIGPLTGLGYDATAGLLWVTDGFFYGAIVPPAAPGCFAAPPVFVSGPFSVPFGPAFFASGINDIEWDASTSSLWACDSTGFIGSFFPSPVPAPALGFWPSAPGFCFPVPTVLVGLALDRAAPGSGAYWVTDGFSIAYEIAGGAPAPTTFYSTSTCATLAVPPVNGLAFTGHALTYAAPSTQGGIAPTISSTGHSYSGNPSFTLGLTGAPGDLATLLYAAGGPSCPALPVAGLLLPTLPPYFSVTAVVVPPGGALTLPAPIPAAAPSLFLDLSWVTFSPVLGTFGSSEGLHLTLTLP